MNAERLRRAERWVRAGAGFVLTDLCGMAGSGLVAYGAWLVYHPAGLMTGGAVLLAGAWLSARNG